VIRAGDTIDDRPTGARIVVRQTARETGGEAVVVEIRLDPRGAVAAPQAHPGQEKRFEVLEGSVGFEVDGRRLLVEAGRRVTVPSGAAHTYWNAGDDVAQLVCEVRPALPFESELEALSSTPAAR
jgi:mannose-6-phosphate isomerase-like protein (cupin superfamily)